MATMIQLPITNRARQYGYVFWPKKNDDQIRKLLGDADSVEVVFQKRAIGKRRVDWKYRRISVGPSHTRALSTDFSSFKLSYQGGGLEIECA